MRRVLPRFLMLLPIVSACGCDLIPDTFYFPEAERELHNISQSIVEVSGRADAITLLIQKLSRGEGPLARAVIDFLNGGVAEISKSWKEELVPSFKSAVKEIGGRLAQNAGAELRLSLIDYTEFKGRAILRKLGRAIQKLQNERIANGTDPTAERLRQILEELSEPIEVEPKADTFVPEQIVVTRELDGTASLVDTEVWVSGFGFKNTAKQDALHTEGIGADVRSPEQFENQSGLRAVLSGGDVYEQSISLSSPAKAHAKTEGALWGSLMHKPLEESLGIYQNTDFLLRITLNPEMFERFPQATEVGIFWNDRKLCSIGVKRIGRLRNEDRSVTLKVKGDAVVAIPNPIVDLGAVAPSHAEFLHGDGKVELINPQSKIDLRDLNLRPDDQWLDLAWDPRPGGVQTRATCRIKFFKEQAPGEVYATKLVVKMTPTQDRASYVSFLLELQDSKGRPLKWSTPKESTGKKLVRPHPPFTDTFFAPNGMGGWNREAERQFELNLEGYGVTPENRRNYRLVMTLSDHPPSGTPGHPLPLSSLIYPRDWQGSVNGRLFWSDASQAGTQVFDRGKEVFPSVSAVEYFQLE